MATACLIPDKTYTLATNDFVGRGGDGYQMFARKKRLVDANAGTLMASQVIQFIAAKGIVSPKLEGRIRAVN